MQLTVLQVQQGHLHHPRARSCHGEEPARADGEGSDAGGERLELLQLLKRSSTDPVESRAGGAGGGGSDVADVPDHCSRHARLGRQGDAGALLKELGACSEEEEAESVAVRRGALREEEEALVACAGKLELQGPVGQQSLLLAERTVAPCEERGEEAVADSVEVVCHRQPLLIPHAEGLDVPRPRRRQLLQQRRLGRGRQQPEDPRACRVAPLLLVVQRREHQQLHRARLGARDREALNVDRHARREGRELLELRQRVSERDVEAVGVHILLEGEEEAPHLLSAPAPVPVRRQFPPWLEQGGGGANRKQLGDAVSSDRLLADHNPHAGWREEEEEGDVSASTCSTPDRLVGEQKVGQVVHSLQLHMRSRAFEFPALERRRRRVLFHLQPSHHDPSDGREAGGGRDHLDLQQASSYHLLLHHQGEVVPRQPPCLRKRRRKDRSKHHLLLVLHYDPPDLVRSCHVRIESS
mmetsp:Transcript_21220/g.47863  ORF Transcript_21220/g.47863 Transcript_21220/m.47863 type:complete len:468 (+) Transcript_21220:385-1788(+)